MSASRSGSVSSLKESRRRPKKATPAAVASKAPWIRNGVDYGPLYVAGRDLVAWAFDLAARDVEDWPVGKRHVTNARRYVRAAMNHKPIPPGVSEEDVAFTAELIARRLDEDLELGLGDVLSIFQLLDLPIELVPALALYAVRVEPLSTKPSPMKASSPRWPPPSLRFCDECGYVHEPGLHLGYRNAA